MVTNLTKQADEFVKGLIDAQQRMWSAVSDSIQSVAGAPADKRWKEGVEASEKLVQDSLEAQADLREKVIERLTDIEAMPDAAVESLEQFEEISEELTKSQQALISNCFDMLKTLDPTPAVSGYGEGFQSAVDRLQKLARRAVDMQMEMVKAWTGRPSTTTKKRTRAAKKGASKKSK